MKRKIFAAFLSLMMVVSMLPTSAFATEVDTSAECQHENAHWETVKEATCTVPGKQVLHCHDCETDLDEKEIPALGHAPKEDWVVVDGSYEPADCENAGHETYVCPNCDGLEEGGSETRDIEADPALGHDIKKTVVDPTCKDGGYTLEECTRGDYSEKTNLTDPTGNHNMVLVSELRKADCKTGTNGIGRYACSVCGESGGYQVIPAEHVKVEDKANSKAATCKDEGKIAYKCSVCGKALESEIIPATGEHTFVEDEIIPATCTENEKVGQRCSVCGEAGKVEEVPGTALGHDMQIDTTKSKAATCTEAGVKVTKCSRCPETKTEEIPALGHNYEGTGKIAEANCEHGAGEWFVCKNDNCPEKEIVKEFEGELAEPKKDHTPEVIPAVDATCTTTGLSEGSKCADCGKILVAQVETPIDENAHKAVVAKELRKAVCGGQTGIARMECELCHKNLGYEVVSAEHVPAEATRVEPTCGKDGKVTYKCARCGEALPDMDEVLPATGEHTFIEKAEYMVTVSEATCTENEKIAYKCSVCGEAGEPEEIPESALGHKYEEKIDDPEYKAVTCEEDGLTVKVCAVCGDRQTEVVKANGKHQWNDGVDTPATCTTPGGATYTCLKCGAPKFEAYTGELAEPAKNHANTEVLEAVPATCSTTGLTEGLKCKDCGKILIPQTETEKNENHKSVVAKELRKAVCGGQTGINRMECALCHTNLGYEVVSNAHIPVEASRVEPTCGEDGKVTYKCSRCGEALPEEDEVLPATGEHTVDEENEKYVKIVDPTCTEAGKLTFLCTVCGAEVRSEPYGAALGHDMQIDKTNPKYKAVTCEEDGLDTLKCSRCPETDEKVVKATGEHQWDEAGAKIIPATCTEGEHLAIECSLCHKVKTQVVDGMQKALGHDLKKDVHPATCKTAGYTLVTCAREGCDYQETIEGEPANKDNHTFGEPYHLRPAKCNATGIDKYTCVDCGYYKYEVAEKLAHTLLDENAQVTKEATCVADGEVTNKCTVCGTVVTEKIPATGKHTPVEIPETDDMSAGEKCAVCGKILKEPVKKTDCKHENVELIEEVPATCTSTGLSVGLKCADCGKVIEAQTVIAKLPHTVEVIPGKDATCTEDGLTAGERCSVCKEILKAQEIVKAAGHKAETVPAVEATCTATGLTAGEKCSVCGEVLKAQETVPMKEHTEEIIEAVAATCTEAGHKEGVKCSVCGTILMQPETIEALGHDFTEFVGAGEDDKGAYIEYKCSRCDATEKQYAE